MKKTRKITFFTLGILLCNFLGKAEEKVNIPRNYTEDIKIEGHDLYSYDYDFDSDGITEKVIVSRKSNSLVTRGALISIYTKKNGNYELSYQIPIKNEEGVFSFANMEKTLKNTKELYKEYSKGIEEGEVRYIEILENNINENVSINLKYDKNSTENIDNFLFIGSSGSLKAAPDSSSATVASLKYKDKPRIIMGITSVKNGVSEKWYLAEFGKENKVRGYIQEQGKNVKRGFHWDKMVTKMQHVNDFIDKTLKENKEVYIITEYRPLASDFYSKKDKFGNRNNQSVKGYVSTNKEGEHINIPDQTLIKILGEEGGMLKIETPMYGGPYYIEKKEGTIKKTDINSKVNKFIVVDPDSQAEAVFERNAETGKFQVVTYSFVTTGKDNGHSSYETPHGAFLVAFTRPYMLFTGRAREGDTRRSAGRSGLVIAGQANYAVRFSGGAYMHGIPASFGASSGAKAYTASKIGTYRESHKCVRHYDDQIKFIVDWVNADSTVKEKENTIPAEPVVVVVL